MSSELASLKEHMYAIHIIDQGISLHSEKFSDFLNIDDLLVFGFISALHSYTYLIGDEEVLSMDYGKAKFLFKVLHDEKLLVVILKNALPQEQEQEMLRELATRYEFSVSDKDISEVKSLINVKERLIPFELVVEMRRKKEKKTSSNALYDEIMLPPPAELLAIPEVKVEHFYLEGLVNEDFLTEKVSNQIKKTLSNFFLGYKKLLMGLFVVVKNDNIVLFAFSRKPIDEMYPLIQYILTDPAIRDRTLDTDHVHPQKIEIENQKLWFLTNSVSKHASRTVLFSLSQDELNSMIPHLSRIMHFLKKVI
ncbi:MAG: hypothetical protein KGD64_08170 [Candidatus Heimdallarchaeota archaeon]|nr:hypothetical protein [Candidatus Heimdallarchaeota archaeon]